jgi:glucokinase
MTGFDGPVVGLDIGGTTTRGVVVEPSEPGRPLASVTIGTTTGCADALVESVVATVTGLARRAGAEPDELGAVGLGIPGVVDPERGEVRHAVNLGVGSEPLGLGARVAAALDVPVVVDNDANAAALGAATVLDTQDDLAYLSIGTGVAVGLLLHGRLRRGWRGAAGEIGHLPVDPAGPECECGQRGCLEVVASGASLAREAGSATALFAAAEAGDADAVARRDRFAGHVAQAVTIIGLTVDPAVVVIGGGVADVGAPLLTAVRHALDTRAESSPLLADLDLAGRLAMLPPGVNAGVIGAVELAVAAVPVGRRAATA